MHDARRVINDPLTQLRHAYLDAGRHPGGTLGETGKATQHASAASSHSLSAAPASEAKLIPLSGAATVSEAEAEAKNTTTTPVRSAGAVIWRPSRPKPRLKHMFWAHVPKTSTTFARSIFSYACGPDVDDIAEIDTVRPPFIKNGTCNEGLSAKQVDVAVNMMSEHHAATWYHMPLPQAAGNASGPSAAVSAIMLLRKPQQRLRSAMAQMEECEHPCTCCSDSAAEADGIYGVSWGWDTPTYRRTWMAGHGLKWARDNDSLAFAGDPRYTNDTNLQWTFDRQRRYLVDLSKSNSLHGCQTKYVLGIGCHTSHELTDEEIDRAVSYVRDTASYVGVMERYAESVCLFHAMHGGVLYEAELKGLDLERAMHPKENPWAQRHMGDMELSMLAMDRADDAVYLAATERFDRLVHENQQDMDECMHQIEMAKDQLKEGVTELEHVAE